MPGTAVAPIGDVTTTKPRARCGSFILHRWLGSGLHARSFLAEHDAEQIPVVLKVLNQTSARQPSVRRLFGREIAMLEALDHPVIEPLHQFGIIGGVPFSCVHFSRGFRVSHFGSAIWAPSWKAQIALEVGADIADALAYAHRRGFVHGNLGSRWVAITANATVRLSGFGIGVLRSSADTTSCTDTKADDVAALGRLIAEMLDPHVDTVLGRALLEVVAMSCRSLPFQRPTAAELAATLRSMLSFERVLPRFVSSPGTVRRAGELPGDSSPRTAIGRRDFSLDRVRVPRRADPVRRRG